MVLIMPSIYFYTGYILAFAVVLAFVAFIFFQFYGLASKYLKPRPVAVAGCAFTALFVLALIVHAAFKDTQRCRAVIAPLIALESTESDAIVINASDLYLAIGGQRKKFHSWIDKRILSAPVLEEGVDYRVEGRGLQAQYFLSRRTAEHLADGTNIASGCLNNNR